MITYKGTSWMILVSSLAAVIIGTNLFIKNPALFVEVVGTVVIGGILSAVIIYQILIRIFAHEDDSTDNYQDWIEESTSKVDNSNKNSKDNSDK